MKTSAKIAIICSEFNQDITSALHQGALARLNELQVSQKNIVQFKVPGAVEIPLLAQTLAKHGNYDAIICLGAVIRGETTHYDYVCQQVSAGCQQVALEQEVPVIFGVLTTENKMQALERVGGTNGHKGKDAVDAAMTMIEIYQTLN